MDDRAELIARLRAVVIAARAEGHYITPITPRQLTTEQLAARLDELQRLLGARVRGLPSHKAIQEMQQEAAETPQ